MNMAEAKTYAGSCHCGKIRYEVTADLSTVIECNCSMCRRKGTMLTFVPPDAMKLAPGAEDVTDYQFHKKKIHHKFCPVCGVTTYADGTAPDGKAMYAINVRCLDGVDLASLKTVQYDGANH